MPKVDGSTIEGRESGVLLHREAIRFILRARLNGVEGKWHTAGSVRAGGHSCSYLSRELIVREDHRWHRDDEFHTCRADCMQAPVFCASASGSQSITWTESPRLEYCPPASLPTQSAYIGPRLRPLRLVDHSRHSNRECTRQIAISMMHHEKRMDDDVSVSSVGDLRQPGLTFRTEPSNGRAVLGFQLQPTPPARRVFLFGDWKSHSGD